MLPPVGAEDQPPPEAPPAQQPAGPGFHGFGSFDTHAQGQVATLTGYLNAFREDNRLVGAVSEINGPPANSINIAAFFQRGRGATFVYGVIGGPGGARGTLPDPPPGEANAYYPTDPPESTFQGPITAGAKGAQVLDSRFYAKATQIPTGRTEGAIQKLVVQGQFSVEQATVVSHTEPADGGVRSESVSVLHQVTVGPLLIQDLVSRAMAFVPAVGGDPVGIASTVIEGATVSGTPVQITDKGVVVKDSIGALGQEKVNEALVQNGFDQVRLLPASTKPGDDKSSVTADAGFVEFVKQDQKFGASNPQGFSGGGFSIGGAIANVSSARCAPNCPSNDLLGVPPDRTTPDTGTPSVGASSSAPPSSAGFSYGSEPASGSTSIDGQTLLTDRSGAGLGTGGGLSLAAGPSLDYSSTTAVTPPSLNSAASGRQSAVPVQQQAALAVSPVGALGVKEADWVRDLFLALGLAAGILFVGQRLAQAF
jgi:hypothetical protein